ncbi:MAG: YdeI/OmpD-associated family protein [Candidatus Dormibacteraeota bacterium]|nr:YdeI/OmpD-associated family protein [Candidatus Dormibacteraeota bacterium]
MAPTFFVTPSEFRAWLEENHARVPELSVGFYKTGSGRPSITWPEAVDQALCFGWIDGVRRGIDDVSYKIRFTPRKTRSFWSAVNIKRVGELASLGQMTAAGTRAFEQRAGERSGVYSYEQSKTVRLDDAYELRFRANEQAWSFFTSQPPWYQRAAIWWVVSAKREETRLRRLAALIEDSERGRTVGPLTRPGASSGQVPS